MANRFSKKTLQAELQVYMNGIQRNFGFGQTGSDQLKAIAQERTKETPRSFETCLEEVTLAYGRYMQIISLATDFDLEISKVPAGYNVKQFWYEGRLFERLISG